MCFVATASVQFPKLDWHSKPKGENHHFYFTLWRPLKNKQPIFSPKVFFVCLFVLVWCLPFTLNEDYFECSLANVQQLKILKTWSPYTQASGIHSTSTEHWKGKRVKEQVLCVPCIHSWNHRLEGKTILSDWGWSWMASISWEKGFWLNAICCQWESNVLQVGLVSERNIWYFKRYTFKYCH